MKKIVIHFFSEFKMKTFSKFQVKRNKLKDT